MRRRVFRARVSHDRWLVSYADFITLLFGFFVVLYAFSKSDQKKQQQITASVDEAFTSLGIFPGASRHPGQTNTDSSEKAVMPMNIVMGEDVLAPARVKEDLEGLKREMQQTLSNEVATHTVSIQMGRDGLVISLREAGFFLRFGHPQTRIRCHAETARRITRPQTTTTCASRATPTTYPSTPPNLIPTGSSHRLAPLESRASFST